MSDKLSRKDIVELPEIEGIRIIGELESEYVDEHYASIKYLNEYTGSCETEFPEKIILKERHYPHINKTMPAITASMFDEIIYPKDLENE